jgi:hypothetical protein
VLSIAMRLIAEAIDVLCQKQEGSRGLFTSLDYAPDKQEL